GLSLVDFFERVRDSDVLVGVVPCFAHVKARDRFFLIDGTGAPEPAELAATPEVATEAEAPIVDEAPVSEVPVIVDEAPVSDVAPAVDLAPIAEPEIAGDDLDESIPVDLEGPLSAPAPVAPPA